MQDPEKAERYRQQRRESQARRRQDPEKAERYRRQARELQARRRQDPEKAERMRQQARESHARRKAKASGSQIEQSNSGHPINQQSSRSPFTVPPSPNNRPVFSFNLPALEIESNPHPVALASVANPEAVHLPSFEEGFGNPPGEAVRLPSFEEGFDQHPGLEPKSPETPVNSWSQKVFQWVDGRRARMFRYLNGIRKPHDAYTGAAL